MKFISNLKQILKAKVLGKSQEEIETTSICEYEELIKQRDIIVKALVSKDLEETVASLNSVQFGEEISKQQHYTTKRRIQILTHILIDYQQLAVLKKYQRQNVIKLVGTDVDFYNF